MTIMFAGCTDEKKIFRAMKEWFFAHWGTWNEFECFFFLLLFLLVPHMQALFNLFYFCEETTEFNFIYSSY